MMTKYYVSREDYTLFNSNNSNSKLLQGVRELFNNLTLKLKEEIHTKGIELRECKSINSTYIDYTVPKASRELEDKLKTLRKRIFFVTVKE